ncbi:MAG: arginase family protein [Arhodomonas sp.]|nr:arginase family protein [Arhodomonas sp.]
MIEGLGRLEGPVWLSVDMDVFDPALVSGVGHAPARRPGLVPRRGGGGSGHRQSGGQPAGLRYR